MKTLLLLLILFLHASADIKSNMLQLYKNKAYEKACNVGFENYKANKRDEEFISLYAFSCLYSDNIDRLSAPAALLKKTKESRANAAYFATIVMQKKLLYYSLVDGYKISEFRLPTTDYVLSKVFELYSQEPQQSREKVYIFADKNNKKIHYKLYLQDDYKTKKMIIEEYYDTIVLKRHEYW